MNKVYRRDEMAHRRIGNDASDPLHKGSRLEWATFDLQKIQEIIGKTRYKDYRNDDKTLKMQFKNQKNFHNFALTRTSEFD